MRYETVLENFRKLMTENYSDYLSLNNPDETKTQIRAIIAHEVKSKGIVVDGMEQDILIEMLYNEIAEYGIITPYLKRRDVEEININAYNDVKITYNTGVKENCRYRFLSPSHAVNTINRLLLHSGLELDDSSPIVTADLSQNERITVIGKGVIDEDQGLACSIRLVNPQKLQGNDFIEKDTLTGEMLDLLITFIQYGISVCISGATNSGKTTLMSYLLSQMPNEMRIFTIEDLTREFNLVKQDKAGYVLNNVIHTKTRYSANDEYNVTMEDILKLALTMNPDIICMAEMKGAESYWAQEASRTGHTVISTTHANTPEGTINRIVTQCLGKYQLDYSIMERLVAEAFPIIVTIKTLKDYSRRVMQICEVCYEDNKVQYLPIYVCEMDSVCYQNGKPIVKGAFKKVNCLSDRIKKIMTINGCPKNVIEKI